MCFDRSLIVALLLGPVGACSGPGGSSSTGAGGDHDAGTSATSTTSGGNNGCDGICVLGPPTGWDFPGLLWVGNDQGNAPGCPMTASKETFEGYADITAPVSCATCTCGPPSGASCTASPATQPPQPAPTWGTFARACSKFPWRPCTVATICVPAPPPGFRVCLYRDGVDDCSDSVLAPYTEAHVLYPTVDDTRSCTACTCAPPSGSMCAPSGGDSMGAATPTNPGTFCCMPLP